MAELLQGLTALWPRLDVDLTTALVMLNGFLLLYLNCEGDLVFTGRTLPEPLTTDVLGRLPLYMASDEVLFRAFGFLLQAINVTIQSVDSPEPRSPETTNRVSDALEIVFFLASGATRGISSLLLDWRQDNLGHSICHRMMARPDLAGILANVLLRIPSQWVTPEVLRLFIWHKKSRGGVAYPNTHVSSASISNWVHAVTGIFEDPDTDASELDALKICCFTIYTFWPGDDGARITSLAMSEEWASLFDTLSKRIAEGLADSQVAALPSDSRSDERRRLAGECLRIICYAESKLHPAAWKEATGECSEADYQHWLASFESFSPFGDHLIDVLDSTASSDEFSRYWRIRRSRQAKGSRMQNMVDQTATDVCHD
ncbi:hypothetical protein BDW22DRAFT_1352552 [Trametopsis cervina]|nr:hypothetical protein BDW22DRAFT_1352552 [Trametopsis cervina]